MTSPPPDPEPQKRFVPPPAEPVSQADARANLLLAAVLRGSGCLLVLLAVIVLAILGAAGGGATGGDATKG